MAENDHFPEIPRLFELLSNYGKVKMEDVWKVEYAGSEINVRWKIIYLDNIKIGRLEFINGKIVYEGRLPVNVGVKRGKDRGVDSTCENIVLDYDLKKKKRIDNWKVGFP